MTRINITVALVTLLIIGLVALQVDANQEHQLVITLEDQQARVQNIKKIVNDKYRQGYRVKHLQIYAYHDGLSSQTSEECIIIFEKK
jgi:predicted Co/Zn/Cd cation transporter (cation efflux family)